MAKRGPCRWRARDLRLRRGEGGLEVKEASLKKKARASRRRMRLSWGEEAGMFLSSWDCRVVSVIDG